MPMKTPSEAMGVVQIRSYNLLKKVDQNLDTPKSIVIFTGYITDINIMNIKNYENTICLFIRSERLRKYIFPNTIDIASLQTKAYVNCKSAIF